MTGLPFVLLAAAFGACVGSFLNVCIYRLPRGESLAWPASHCTSCSRPLSWYENIPIASWLALRGRCRSCRAPITVRYPIVELVTAALFAGAWAVYGPTPLLAVRLLFIAMLVVLFAIDLEHYILPNVITYSGVVIGLASSLMLPPGWLDSLLGVVVGGLFPFLVAEAYLRIRGREGMGMGDFKMLAMVGAFLGLQMVWITLLLACALGIVIGGGALLASRRGMGARLPFGTFIAVAATACVLWGDRLAALYQQWFGVTA